MNLEIENGSAKLSSTSEQAAVQIARDNDATLCELAKAHTEAQLSLAIRLGMEQQKVVVLTGALADKEARISDLQNRCNQLEVDLAEERQLRELSIVDPANDLAA